MTGEGTGDFLGRVESAYQGEVYGEALYNGIADMTTDPTRSKKWRVLADLEVVTKAQLRQLVAKLGGDIEESVAAREEGLNDVGKYANLPWDVLMELYSKELEPVIALYAELERECQPEDAPTLRFLTEHEVVTKAFCDLERAGQSDISIQPTLDLIASARQRLDSSIGNAKSTD